MASFNHQPRIRTIKKLILIILFALVAQSAMAAFATDVYAETEEQEADRVWCEWYGKTAEMVMTGRQKGHPYSLAVSEARTLSEESQSVVIGLIDEAWSSPIVEGKALKFATALLFQQNAQEWCLDYYGLTKEIQP